jgi:microcystin-dependent protein
MTMQLRRYFNRLRTALLPALVFALVAHQAYGAYYSWSKTAGANATADASINWAEGQSPSSVNDSARAMMARLKEWGDDISGVLAAGGTATAYTVTTNQVLPATPADGVVICITPGTTNGVGVTLAADGGTAFAIQSPAGTGVGAGTLVASSPYCLMFKTNAWLARSFYGNPFNVPLGAVLDYTGDTAPNSNFVIADGSCISRTTYAAYFTLVSTRFSVCDGTTTFGVPDLRGRVTPGQDNMGSGAANRMTSGTGCGVAFTSVGVVCGSESHTLTTAELAVHSHANSLNDPTHSHNALGGNNFLLTAGGGAQSGSGIGGQGSTTAVSATGMTITNANAGSGSAHSIVQPSLAVKKIVRIF